MFIQTNDRLVNLKNVSNINLSPKDNRIIFNMNYSIEIQRNETKMISDYAYWDLLNSMSYNDTVLWLEENKFVESNFLRHENGFININEISSVKFSDKKYRVIFNLSHPVTFTDYNTHSKSITSEFIYCNFDMSQDYYDFVTTVKNTLLG